MSIARPLPLRSAAGLIAAGVLSVGAALVTLSAAAAVVNPTVTGPIAQTAAPGDPSHNYIFFSSNHDLPGHGYVEEEFFVQGTATRYSTPKQTNPDATSAGVPIGSISYKTRIVVRRPSDPSKFNGVVLVEWYNVANNFDAENIWFFNGKTSCARVTCGLASRRSASASTRSRRGARATARST